MTMSCGLSYPSINRFHYLLAARAESVTLLREDRAWRCSETKSNHLIDLVSMIPKYVLRCIAIVVLCVDLYTE